MRNKHTHSHDTADDIQYSFCDGCGGEYHDSERRDFHNAADPKQRVTLCEDCCDVAVVELMGKDDDALTNEEFQAVLEGCKLQRIISFIPADEQILDVGDVREFFKALSDFIIWHPDTPFSDYVSLTTKERLFDDPSAEELDKCMAKCFDVCEQMSKAKPDVYEIAIEAFNKAKPAPTTGGQWTPEQCLAEMMHLLSEDNFPNDEERQRLQRWFDTLNPLVQQRQRLQAIVNELNEIV